MRRVLLACLLTAPLAANADIVDIKWSGESFAHKAGVAPGKFLEACGKLKKGEAIAWQFKGSGATDFNIHYHVGNDVTYPENRKGVASAEGKLVVTLDQDFCWMWSNRSGMPVEVEVSLKQVKAGK